LLFDNPPDAVGTSITCDDFNKGYTIFRFRVTPDQVRHGLVCFCFGFFTSCTSIAFPFVPHLSHTFFDVVVSLQVKSLPNARGNVKLDGRFSKALPDNVTLLVVGKFHQVLSIDESRRITL